jgi:AcrR family transcriptional regulator
VRELPRRAHSLSRRTVTDSQRWRMLEAITEVVAKRGYADANVADVIAAAGVSRKTFYEQFRDKEHCFLSAFEAVGERLLGHVVAAGEGHPPGPARRRAQIARFLVGLANDPLGARVFLVDVLGAGRRSLRLRQILGTKFGHALVGDAGDPILRAAIVGGINSVVRGHLIDGEPAELPALADALAAFVERVLR